MEYEYDRDEVEQIQGRLATDQVNDEIEKLQVPNENQDEKMQQMEEEIEKTKAEAKKEQAGKTQKATEAK